MGVWGFGLVLRSALNSGVGRIYVRVRQLSLGRNGPSEQGAKF